MAPNGDLNGDLAPLSRRRACMAAAEGPAAWFMCVLVQDVVIFFVGFPFLGRVVVLEACVTAT